MVVVTLFVFAASQLRVLKIRISKYGQGRDMNDEQKKVVLKQLIAKHLYLIGFIKNLNNRTKYILLMEYLLSSVDLSSVAVNLAKETTIQTIWHFIFFLLLFLQIMIMAWTTNEVKLQSVAIADGIYNSDWYTLNKENAKLIHIMILRAQRPLVLTIGPFGPMTTETGVKILKVAYSYVSIMKQ
ncbi:odorant receptor Or2-like [Anthonomus grandis grandis]|uniref:odorant receptor Or2-like n=1 Tax=Anthonomus grandis grandis TaxID=2921223 RepID=UPI0021650447|nr:odorant receptor Or2-like [Anthonomus grandis grandis]